MDSNCEIEFNKLTISLVSKNTSIFSISTLIIHKRARAACILEFYEP